MESLYYGNHYDSAHRLVNSLKPSIKNSSALIIDYYYLQGEYFTNDTSGKKLYADSALNWFADESLIKKHPDEYFKALMLKADVCLKTGKYILALNYYYKCKNAIALGVCDNGDLEGKIGTIYFAQRNYALAGKYWGQSYYYLKQCHKNISTNQFFFMAQGCLDNTAFAYDKAGMMDSARYYYQKDIDLLKEYREKKLVDTVNINQAQAIVDDNFGGLNVETGDLTAAKHYLEEAIASPYDNNSGAGISSYIKAAEMYTNSGDLSKADWAFTKAQYLLNKYDDGNPDPKIMLLKGYSQYLLKRNDLAGAYQYLDRYNKMRDEQTRNNADLYRLDVVREFNDLQQKQLLSVLKLSNRQKKTYMLSIAVTGVLFIIIFILIYRNLKRTEKSNRLITLQNTQLQHTLLELERVNKNHIRIMRVMAHDLRNPLSGMAGLASVLLLEEGMNEERQHILKLIESTGMQTIEMISELLKTGLADENEKVVKAPLDIRALVLNSVELLQFRANEKQQELVFESDEEPVMMDANQEKLWRVINNLVVNAIKFSHHGGVIRIKLISDDQKVVISVKDNGIGIPEDQKDIIFEMFTPAKKPGTDGEQPFGLGLSITKRIVDMHNGNIWLESEVGKGTTFFVELPSS